MAELRSKDSPGRGSAVIVYGLYLGAIMTVVTLPLGALLAWWRLGRSADWVGTHLRFQLWTFLGLAASGIAAPLLWQLLGQMAAPPMSAWAFRLPLLHPGHRLDDRALRCRHSSTHGQSPHRASAKPAVWRGSPRPQ